MAERPNALQGTPRMAAQLATRDAAQHTTSCGGCGESQHETGQISAEYKRTQCRCASPKRCLLTQVKSTFDATHLPWAPVTHSTLCQRGYGDEMQILDEIQKMFTVDSKQSRLACKGELIKSKSDRRKPERRPIHVSHCRFTSSIGTHKKKQATVHA